MAQDLVTQIVQGLGSATTDHLSSVVGTDRATMQRAVGGAVPAIMAGLLSVVSRPGGGDRLSSLIGQLGNLGATEAAVRPIGQDNRQALMEQGSTLLSSLFGGQGVDALVSGIAHYAGLDQGMAGKLLGFVTPLILGLLGRQAQASGAGTSGLASMLLNQKDAIASALPSELANRLQGAGLLSGVTDRLGEGIAAAAAAAKSSAASISQGVEATTSAVSGLGAKVAQSAATPSRGMPRWLYGVVAVAVLAVLAYWLLGRSGEEQASRLPASTSAQTEGSGTSTAVGQIDLGPQLTNAFDKTRSVLQQVNDPESARKALPQLDDMVAQLDKLANAAALAPDQQKKMVIDMVTKAQPSIKDLMDKALAKPGVADVLKPTLDAFKSKLAALAST